MVISQRVIPQRVIVVHVASSQNVVVRLPYDCRGNLATPQVRRPRSRRRRRCHRPSRRSRRPYQSVALHRDAAGRHITNQRFAVACQ